MLPLPQKHLLLNRDDITGVKHEADMRFEKLRSQKSSEAVSAAQFYKETTKHDSEWAKMEFTVNRDGERMRIIHSNRTRTTIEGLQKFDDKLKLSDDRIQKQLYNRVMAAVRAYLITSRTGTRTARLPTLEELFRKLLLEYQRAGYKKLVKDCGRKADKLFERNYDEDLVEVIRSGDGHEGAFGDVDREQCSETEGNHGVIRNGTGRLVSDGKLLAELSGKPQLRVSGITIAQMMEIMVRMVLMRMLNGNGNDRILVLKVLEPQCLMVRQ